MTSRSQVLASLDAVGVCRQGRWLIRDVSIAVRRGAILTLIGPNGAGKSTTAKLALGILKPDEGRITRADGLRVGYVPQRLTIDWSLPLTVARFMVLTGRTAPAEIDAALDMTGTGHLRASPMQSLSGGEFQRVLLARALARKPDFLVLDEPVQGVDLAGEVALYELIARARDSLGCGILMVSHDLHVVMAATDEVVCLNGHVCCSGTPHAVSESPEYRRMFGSRAADALAVYRHDHDHTHLANGSVRHIDGSVTEHCHPDDGHHHHHDNSDGCGAMRDA
jgi:zinc transport system ATP-binding protein